MSLRTLRVFISSPGDVAEERLIARRVIGRLEAQFGDLVRIEAVFWERAPLVATASFQEQLLRPSETDVTILILWSRLGTPLPAHIVRDDGSTYASGTEFEFEDAMAGFARSGTPRILAYRKTAPIAPPADLDALAESVRQQQAMERFVAKWFRNEADGTLKAAFHNFATPADFEDVFEAHLAQIAEHFLPPGVAARGNAPTWRGSSPFRGLAVFEPEHAPVFFGRTAATASVLAKLRAQGQAGKAFVLIVSMSGGGKSSLVRAGVLPLMTQPGVIGTATAWRSAVMRPSDGQGRLVDALERALVLATTIGAGDGQSVIDDGGPEAIVRRVVQRLDAIAVTTDLVLVVDQLEEAFSDERVTPDARDAFFATLDALARSGRVWIIATMRSDAYPLIAVSPTLVVLKEGDGQYDLMPPTLREIGQIIRFPASAAGLRFEVRTTTGEKLDDVIRDAAASNPGALPLLQFLLEALYQRRNAEDVLTFRAYEDLGGVEGALAQRAEAVLAGVSEEAQKALPNVLRELVTFGTDDDSKALRRVAPRSAFESSAAIELVDALVEARLLVSALGPDGTSTIALAHEALLEYWPRLKAWRDEDRELLLVHARLAAATREWEKNARNDDLLLARGKPLAEARGLVGAGMRLTPEERALLTASESRARRFAMLRNSAIAGLAALTVVAGIAAWKATSESKRAQVQATTAQRTTDFMVGLFADADPEQNRGDQVTVREVLDRGVDEIDAQLQGEDAVRSNLLRAMGEAYNGLGQFEKAKTILAKAVEQAAKSALPEDQLKARWAFGRATFENGDYQDAERIFRESLAASESLHGPSSSAAAISHGWVADSLRKQNQYRQAEVEYRQSLSIAMQLGSGEDLETAKALDGLGTLMVLEGKLEAAEPLLQRSLNLQRAVLGSRHAKLAVALNNLGLLYFQAGDYTRAVNYWNEALPVVEQVYGRDHSMYALLLNNLGRVELLTNRLGPAREHMAAAVAISRKLLSADHDDLVPPLNSLAMILTEQNDLVGAKALAAEALRLARMRNHPFLNQVLATEAEIAVRSGDSQEAEAALDEARKLLVTKYGAALTQSERWRASILDVTQAQVDLARNRRAEGAVLVSDAFPVLAKRFGPESLYAMRAKRLESKF